jgi:hypothetical protein
MVLHRLEFCRGFQWKRGVRTWTRCVLPKIIEVLRDVITDLAINEGLAMILTPTTCGPLCLLKGVIDLMLHRRRHQLCRVLEKMVRHVLQPRHDFRHVSKQMHACRCVRILLGVQHITVSVALVARHHTAAFPIHLVKAPLEIHHTAPLSLVAALRHRRSG